MTQKSNPAAALTAREIAKFIRNEHTTRDEAVQLVGLTKGAKLTDLARIVGAVTYSGQRVADLRNSIISAAIDIPAAAVIRRAAAAAKRVPGGFCYSGLVSV